MAGIGFEIRKTLKKKTLFSLVEAYSYSGIVSSGPWIISMISIFISGYLANKILHNSDIVLEFTISITYLIALSLIFTGFFQLSFTRYLSDRLFEDKLDDILPNTLGALVFNMAMGAIFIFPFSYNLYQHEGFAFAILFELNFVVFCGIWIANVILSGLKNYKFIAFAFFISYSLIVILIYFLGHLGKIYLFLSFFIGQNILLLMLVGLIAKNFSAKKWFEFDFLKKGRMYPSLIFTGFLMNISVWIDKFIFWFNPQTGVEVAGVLRFAPMYDFPIFLAYVTIAPGMAMFLLRVETEFVEHYDKYYNAVRDGGTLKELYKYGNHMIDAARYSLMEILRIQILSTIVFIIFAKEIFGFFHMPLIYLPIFYVDLIGVALQLFLMSITVILFYLNKKREVLILSLVLFILNGVLSYVSIQLGPFFYGYGFSIAYFIASILAVIYLNKIFQRLYYETFMLS